MPFNGLPLFLPTFRRTKPDYRRYVSMPFNGLLHFLLMKKKYELLKETRCQCPSTGYFIFYPIPLNKNPYFSSLPSVFIFSALFRKFLVCMTYIGTFLHLHNLNKAISHIFQKNILTSCSPHCYPALSFLVKVFKIA